MGSCHADTGKAVSAGKRSGYDRRIEVQDLMLLSLQHRDEIEDAELELSQVSEGMPMMMAGFKDHPLSVQARVIPD